MKISIKAEYVLLFILCVASALRFYHIDYQSVWLDEICSITEANPKIPWADLEMTILASDPHPPLYFALLKIMFLLFGYTTSVARIFSAIVGVAGIYAIFLLGKEIKNSKVGLIAAALLTLNYFHIYHSQEVRMYGLLALFTMLSFYGLLRFLKETNLKRAIFYGVFTGLMLLTQFFGLFVLAAQLFILLVCFIRLKKTDRMNFFYKSLISGGIMIVFFMPALNIFIATSKRKYEAMAPLTVDIVKQIFIDFVRESNYLLLLAAVAITFYFYIAIKNKATKKEKGNKSFDDLKITFILLSWILITLIIPIVRSYLVTPMIVSRYFITILPPIVLLIALGIAGVKNKIISYGFLMLFLGVSFYGLISPTNYYSAISKTQFREVTQFVIKENTKKDPVVSNLSWYLIYLLDNDTVKTTLIQHTLEEHIAEMQKNPLSVKSFWYFAAFGDSFAVSSGAAKFLDDNFVIAKNLVLYNAATIHYELRDKNAIKEKDLAGDYLSLSEISDENWIGGVGITYNMFLFAHSPETENILKNAMAMKFKDGRTAIITGYEKVGPYIHLHIQGNVNAYTEVAKFPNRITFISKKEQP